jgi:hypothetical protein
MGHIIPSLDCANFERAIGAKLAQDWRKTTRSICANLSVAPSLLRTDRRIGANGGSRKSTKNGNGAKSWRSGSGALRRHFVATDTGEFDWRAAPYLAPLPVYNLPMFAANPEWRIIITDTEKHADRACIDLRGDSIGITAACCLWKETELDSAQRPQDIGGGS